MKGMRGATALLALLVVAFGASQAFALVTQPDTTCVCPRRSVLELDTAAEQPQRDLLLLALRDMQTRSTSDPSSYYQLARIHGAPGTPYDGIGRGAFTLQCASQCTRTGTNSGKGDGMCWHSSQMFPTWHRPYLALFEQEVIKSAKTIAATYPEGSMRDTYVAAANQLRLPFWAWDDPITSSIGVPRILTDAQRPVLLPTGQTANIANPLASYRYQAAAGSHGANTFTFRGNNFNSSVRQSAASWRSAVTASFSQTNWPAFASQSAGGRSIESPHGSVHVTVGGDMQSVSQAAFDPIFWLHHCNVDKLIAQYQALRPSVWMPERIESFSNYAISTVSGRGYWTGPNIPLWPFRKDANGAFWNSNQARDITAMGYTVPGVGSPAGCCAAPAANQRSAKPKLVVPEDPYKGSYRTIVALEGLDASQCGEQSFTVHCYLEDKASKKTRKYLPKDPYAGGKKDRTYAGSYNVFTSGHAIKISGEIDITDPLLSLGYIKKNDSKRKPPKDLVKKYVRLIAVGVDGKRIKRAVKLAKVAVKYGHYVNGLFEQGSY